MTASEMSEVPVGFWRSLRVLLAAARRRARGRHDHDRRLDGGGQGALNAGCLGVLVAVLFAVFTHGAGAFVVLQAVKASQRIAIEQQGRLVVDQWFLDSVTGALHDSRSQAALDADIADDLEAEAVARAGRDGSTREAQAKLLRDALHAGGAAAFVTEDDVPGFDGLTMTGLPALFGSLALLAWSATLVLQGEGLELDVQRRRHPMWEWVFTHPVSPAAVFFAEMLKPLATNPVYWSAPLFPGVLYGILFGPLQGLAAAIIVGVPIAVSTACLGKALEIVVTLRASSRWRGALLGIMNWIGFSAGMALFLLAVTAIDSVVRAGADLLGPLADLPWPWLAIFLGRWTAHHSSFLAGMLTVWVAAATTILGSLSLAVWSASAGFGGPARRPPAAGSKPARTWYRLRFRDNPLYRKEVAWLVRDRSALAQAILLPLTLAAFQLFNFSGLVRTTPNDWTFIAAGTIVLGTFFLLNLGTRSLAADAPAIWIALTWPQRIEGLVEPRMRLWTILSSGIVGLVLAFSAWRQPSAAPAILFVWLLWIVFARSIARKLVARARTTDDPSDPRLAAAARNWVVTLGALAFAIGVVARQWPLAIVAVLFSWLTAAAMWRRFRVRLPVPLDPWSARHLPAPTLMHAMIALSGLVDGGALATGFVVNLFRTNVATAFPIAYGLAAAGVAATAWQMLAHRAVSLRDIWLWPRADGQQATTGGTLLVGAGLGVALGAIGCLYVEGLRQLAPLSGVAPAGDPSLRLVILVVAVAIAPAAQEYLFRGLLYRALDRAWGGWRAVLGSAALFAIYQPAGFWLPAALVGVVAALVFKRTGHLWPAVLLQSLYSAMVLGWMFFVVR